MKEALAGIGIGTRDQGPVTSSPPVPAGRISGKTLSYDQLVDILLLSPPGETQRQLAQRVGYSESWLSRLIASDAFQAKLATRLEKDIEPERREIFRMRFASIEQEAKGILLASLKRLTDRLHDPANATNDELLLKSASMTSKLLGYGAKKDPPVPHVEMHLHLQNLAENVRRLNHVPVTIDQPPGTPGE